MLLYWNFKKKKYMKVLAINNKGAIFAKEYGWNYNMDQRKIGILATLCNQLNLVTNPKIE